MSDHGNNTPFSVGNIWFPALSYNTFVPPQDKASEFQLGLNLNVVIESAEHLIQLEDGKHVYRFAAQYSIRNVNMADKENKLVFEAGGLLRGDIIMDEKIDDELVKKFIEANQNVITFPYIRTNIDSILAKVGLPVMGMIIVY